MERKKILVIFAVIIMCCYETILGSYSVLNNGEVDTGFVDEIVQLEPIEVNPLSQRNKTATYNRYIHDNTNFVYGINQWKRKKGHYQYPVTPEDKEWKKCISVDAKYASCQIPEKLLEELTTEELYQLVLDCPMLADIMFSDSYQEGS